MNISVRLVDCAYGVPAAGVAVRFDLQIDNVWQRGVTLETNRVGRLDDVHLTTAGGTRADRHRMTVDIGGYFAHVGMVSCHPEIVVVFVLPEPSRIYHLEVGASAYGYSATWTND